MNYLEMKQIAMKQLAIDMNCLPNDFKHTEPILVESILNEGRMKFINEPHFCQFAYFGKNVVVSLKEEMHEFMKTFIQKYDGYRYFDTPQLIVLNNELSKYNHCITFLAEYYLYDPSIPVSINNDLEIKIIYEEEIHSYYSDSRFQNALSYNTDSIKKDVIAAIGTINGEVVGIAGASNDSDTMWQIGIDVIPEYRNQGIASTLTNRLAKEILMLNKVPFYCCAWSNIASKNNAIKSGFKPTWVVMSAKPIDFAFNMIDYKTT